MHQDAVQDALRRLPEDLATSPTAVAALGIARSLDELGVDSFRFQAGLVKELRECMAELAAKAPAKAEGDSVDDLAAARAARRRTAASGQ
jgi:hypothetical protein